MATCSADGTARVWDCATGEQLYEFVGEPNECACSVAYRPQVNYTCGKNGSDVTKAKTVRALAVGFSGGASRVYDVETTAVIAEHRQHKGDVVSVQFTPDGSRMITAGGEGNLCVYDAKNGYLPVKYLATVRVYFNFYLFREIIMTFTCSLTGVAHGPRTRRGIPGRQVTRDDRS